MKIIFLDFDGVLAHYGFMPDGKGKLIDHFDPKCVKVINELCVRTGAKVVVHSTWARVDTPEHICQRLSEAGFVMENLHPEWLCNSTHDKNAAIAVWLLAHPDVEKYLVIDDERIGKHPQAHIYHGMFKGGISKYPTEFMDKILL